MITFITFHSLRHSLGHGVGTYVINGRRFQVFHPVDVTVVVQVFGCTMIQNGGSGEVLQQKPCSNKSDVDTPDMVLRPNAIVEPRAYRVSVTTVGTVPVALAKEKRQSCCFQLGDGKCQIFQADF